MVDEADLAYLSCRRDSTSAIEPRVASAATAAATVPRRTCRTTGASARPDGGVTYEAADEGVRGACEVAGDEVIGAGRLLPR